MKSFKQYITESSEDISVPPHSLYLSKTGNPVTARRKPLQSLFYHHGYIPITQPEDFGLSEKAMYRLHDPDEYPDMRHVHDTGETGSQYRLQKHLANLGFYQTSFFPNSPITKRNNVLSVMAHHKGDIFDLRAALRGFRDSYPHLHPLEVRVFSVKHTEIDDIHPDIIKSLKTEHLDRLMENGTLHFTNTEDFDRFLGLGKKIGRDPGSGVEPIPSPAEAMKKAGTTDEPKSIQQGRFFQSDSYEPNFKDYISEDQEQPSKMGHLVTVGTNMEDADFWITRRGSIDKVGHPTKEYNPEHFGVKVTRTDILDPRYAYYMFQHLATKGHFRQFAKGATNLVNIKANDITDISFPL